MSINASFEDFPASIQKDLTEISEDYMKDINNWSLFENKLVLDYKIKSLSFMSQTEFLIYVDITYLTKTELVSLRLGPLFYIENIDHGTPYIWNQYFPIKIYYPSLDFIEWIQKNVR